MTGHLAPALTLADAEAMRIVRNACRQFMTNDTREISAEDQRLWFAILDRSTMRPFVYRVDDQVIGYGLIKFVDNRWWISGGLLSGWRGYGHGKRLFSALADLVRVDGKTCWLTVREDNFVARRTYLSLGFEIIDAATDGISATLTMRRQP